MKRFKNILLVYSNKPDEEQAIVRAVDLAIKNMASLTVFSVVEDLPAQLSKALTTMPAQDFFSLVTEHRRKAGDTLAVSIGQKGINVVTQVVTGSPFLEIIRQVLRQDHDLVIMTDDAKGGVKGSTTMHLMRKCPCPLWVIKPTSTQSYSRILAAIDPRPDDDTRITLSCKIMELATSFAQRDESELHIVHAWDMYGESLLRGRAPGPSVDVLVEETKGYHDKQLQDLLKVFDLNTIKHRIHLLKGEPSLVITNVANSISPELIVMGTVCRTGLAGFFIGNTAENILNRVSCSVLAVKPDEFVTPVTLKN